MDPYTETFNTWNKVAELYQEKFMDLDLYNGTYNAFCTLLEKRNAAVLEIGCGPGNITRHLLSNRPDFSLLGIDIAPNMIALAKKNNPAAQFEVMDSRNIGQLDRLFDGIVCGFCLPYLSETDARHLIKDCRDLLSTTGLFYLSFVEGDNTLSGYQTGSSGDRTYFYYHSLGHLKSMLGEHDFKIMHLAHIHYPKKDGTTEVHTVLIAKK